MANKDLRPAVHFPPPLLFVAGVLMAWLLEKKVHRFPIAASQTIDNVGVALMIAGAVVGFWGMITFARAKTGILPGVPANQIVSHGPYRYTRNPMYTGMATAYLGIAFVMNSWWAVILFPIVIFMIHKFVIQPEESYLTAAFPIEYPEYRKRVRRWI